ncbi:SDR family oxidoreductase [Neolewinella litorea]|uniref:SDR family oxidoreductase n=1 Tax=Neolewinella litorea TaxID=2562452 RepID=A0A4S4NSC4_9BACT|nr:SDR family oxidoreductase [Neolewinella litorea]
MGRQHQGRTGPYRRPLQFDWGQRSTALLHPTGRDRRESKSLSGLGIVTGASSGIGRALAREHARRERDLILVARREPELNALAAELRTRYGVTVDVLARDLTDAGSREELSDYVNKQGLTVDYLFNNAGFGGTGDFAGQDWGRLSDMIQLNVVAVTEFMHLFLPGMIERGYGRILNTSSTAAFMPGPGQAVYFATKAFVNSVSKAVAAEVSGSGVTVTALCPGAVDTGFAETADMADSLLFKTAGTPESTARQGYTAMEAGRLEVITEVGMGMMIKGVLPFTPERLSMAIIKKLQS